MLESRDLIMFDEDETRRFDVEKVDEEGGRVQVRFNKESSHGYTKGIEFPGRILSHITGELESLNDQHKLTEQILTLYEKFVLGIFPKEKNKKKKNVKSHSKSKKNNPKQELGNE